MSDYQDFDIYTSEGDAVPVVLVKEIDNPFGIISFNKKNVIVKNILEIPCI